MRQPYRKKLIEVALPLAAINAESAREKSIRHGHPSTLHLWWARRPLAACRAVLFASLVDDPDSDPHYLKPNGSVDEEAAGIKRADLFNLIEELVMWENSNNPDVIRTARAEIARCVASRLIETGVLKKDAKVGVPALAGKDKSRSERPAKAGTPTGTPTVTAYDLVKRGHCRPIPTGLDKKVGRVRFSFDVSELPPAEAVNAFLAEHAPPVLDPFCGGGSIPLEAQRLGLRAYASDLNPVPVLINKALIEIPPKFAGQPPVNPKSRISDLKTRQWPGATGLAEDVRYYGQWMRDEAEKRIGHLYPKVEVTAEMAKDRPDLEPYVGQKLTVIAWIWARTVASPNPAAHGAHVPLVRSFWLSTKKDQKAWVQPVTDTATMTYGFSIGRGSAEAPEGTVDRNGANCLLTGVPIPLDHVRYEGKAARLGQRLMAIVAEGNRERVFLPPIESHERVSESANPQNYPDTDLPDEALGFRVQNYGMLKHHQLFTNRQLVAMTTFADLVGEARKRIIQDAHCDLCYADAVVTYLAFAVDRVVDRHSSIATWDSSPSKLQLRNTFARHAIQMTWDFGEGNPFCMSSGTWTPSVDFVAKAIVALPSSGISSVQQCNATDIVGKGLCLSTDPPYYDNVPYADLSDFFYVWLRRGLQFVYPDLLKTVLVPKADELVADPFRHGGKHEAKEFFEKGMFRVLERMRQTGHTDVPTTIYYAFKQTEDDDEEGTKSEPAGISRSSTGWETFLQALVETGWQLTGTWPMRTELGNRMRSMGSNALASSIVLVCRPRPDDAPLATRKEFITALRRELPDALRNLQRGSIAPVDLAQAAIGPGMAVFTRYAKVMESDGAPMSVRTALGLINQALDEVLAEQEGEFDGDTRWALAWFEQFGMDDGPFGDAETLSKAKNTAVNGLIEAGIVTARGGKVRLVKRAELDTAWDPATDKRLTVWEITQHLIRTLEQEGEPAAAALVHRLGGMAETARDLAYRLYSLCERKKWAEEALAYNGLVIAWPELTKLALAGRSRARDNQQEMF